MLFRGHSTSSIDASRVRTYAWYVLGVLFLVNSFNFVDRQILAILQEGIKHDLGLSDSQLGFLFMGFSVFYLVAGFPIAWLADRGVRRTIISVGIALWSAMTVACGASQNFVQLAAARFGVGVGEASASPAGSSLLSDYFPPEHRSSAFAVLSVAVHVGIFLGFAIGGWVAAEYGWRMAFLVAGVPGFLLALVVRATIREPQRGRFDPVAATADAPPVKEVLAVVWRRRSLRHMAVATMASVMAGASMFAWGPSFLIRMHDLPKAEIGLIMGALTAVFGALGTLGAGLATERLVRRDVRYYFWVPAFGALAPIPPLLCFLLWPTGQAIWFIGPLVLFCGMYLGPVAAITQTLLPQRMRALAVALLHTFTTLVGTGLGPQLVGIASDLLHPLYGVESLGIAMLVLSVVVYVWSFTHYVIGGRHLRADLAAAERGR